MIRNIPDWSICEQHCRKEKSDACSIERFICENEPAAKKDAAKFRRELLEALNAAFEQGMWIGEQWDGEPYFKDVE